MAEPRRIVTAVLLTSTIFALAVSPLVAQHGLQTPPQPESAQPRRQSRLTAKQSENLEARITTANAIIRRLEPEAKARGRADIWRRATLESLLALPLRALRQVEADAVTVEALSVAAQSAADDPNLIGDPSEDLVYTPITPCRYIDTRHGPKISSAAPRSYDLANTGATYGGSGSCGAPQGIAAALAANVTITEPDVAPGFLAFKPTLAAPVTSFMNWYEAGAHVQVANSGVVTVNQAGGAEFVIQVSDATHAIVDFFGYFAEPEATVLDRQLVTANAPIAANNNAVVSVACPAGYLSSGGGCTSSSFLIQMVSSFQQGTGWICAANNATAAAGTITVAATCVRIPGR
jgi:hypothetical protein